MGKALFDYYYGNEGEQFTFYRIPKVVFTDNRFSSISLESKLLYGIMLDRMSFSVKNKWYDENNRVYIIFTIREIMKLMSCAEQKANKLLIELDVPKGIGLIERKRQGLGKPNIIYVKNFIAELQTQNCENHKSGNAETTNLELPKSQIKECENHKSRNVNITSQEMRKSQTNKTNINKNDLNDINKSDTNLINQSVTGEAEKYKPPPFLIDKMDERKTYRQLILKNIDYDISKTQYNGEMLNEIIEIMTDAVCTSNSTLRIAGEDFTREVVKSRLLKINSKHIEYIFESINKNTTKVRNIKSYLLTTIYNSVSTMNHYYAAEVNHDLYGQT